jgi:hypothetical protein
LGRNWDLLHKFRSTNKQITKVIKAIITTTPHLNSEKNFQIRKKLKPSLAFSNTALKLKHKFNNYSNIDRTFNIKTKYE